MRFDKLKLRIKHRLCKHSCWFEGLEYYSGEACFSYVCNKCGKRLVFRISDILCKIKEFAEKDCSQYNSETIAYPDLYLGSYSTTICESGRNVGRAVSWYYEKYGVLIRAYKDRLDRDRKEDDDDKKKQYSGSKLIKSGSNTHANNGNLVEGTMTDG